MNNKSKRQIFLNGLLYENPLLVTALGICSALAMTSKAADAMRAGAATAAVLFLCSTLISALKRVIPRQVRIPCCMLIIAAVVTAGRLLADAYIPAMSPALSDYLPLLVVNCVILGRGEIFAFQNSISNSGIDALGSGAGYWAALVLTAVIREIIGSGSLFGIPVLGMDPLTLFIMAPGGLFTIGILMAVLKKILSLDKPVSQAEICKNCPAAVNCPQNGKGGCTR